MLFSLFKNKTNNRKNFKATGTDIVQHILAKHLIFVHQHFLVAIIKISLEFLSLHYRVLANPIDLMLPSCRDHRIYSYCIAPTAVDLD